MNVLEEKKYILESERLKFRKVIYDDFDNLRTILSDIEIMYAWEHTFNDDGIKNWIDDCINRYEKDGCAYFVVEEKNTGNFIGLMGPLIEHTDIESCMGIAYILDKKYWGMGYALEGARASVEYAFEILKAPKVIAQIRPNNFSSRKVAEKLGMKIEREYPRLYRGKIIPHLVYFLENPNFL